MILDDVLMHSQDIGALEAAHALLRTISSQQKYSKEISSLHSLLNVLEKMGFGGLWRGSIHSFTEDIRVDCFELTEKLIEVRISYLNANFFLQELTQILAHNYLRFKNMR